MSDRGGHKASWVRPWRRFCAGQLAPFAGPPRVAELAGVFFMAWIVAALVRHVYWNADFSWDDRVIQLHLGLIQTGHKSLLRFVFEPWNTQWMPLWKFLNYVMWRVAGLRPLVWHLVGEWFQAGSVVALYGLMLHYCRRRLPATIAALLWASMALGRWEDVLVFPYSAHNAGSMAFFLWALYAQTRIPSGHALAWSAVAAVSLTVTFTLWGTTWAWWPVFAWHEWRIRRSEPSASRWRAAPTALRLAPIALCGIGTLWVGWSTAAEKAAASMAPLGAAAQVMAQFATVIGHMVGPTALEASTSPLWWESLLAVTVAGLALLHRDARTPLLLLFGLGAIHLSLVALFRAEWNFEASLAQARYLYQAAPFWCAAIGAALGMWRGRIAQHSGWFCAGALAVSALIAAHQAAAARVARAEFARGWDGASAVFAHNRELLRSLAGQVEHREGPTALPDFPVWLPPVNDVYYPLSAFRAVCRDRGTENLEIVPASWLNDEQIAQAAEFLSAQGDDLARDWGQLATAVHHDVRALEWLDRFVADEGFAPQVPDHWRIYGPLYVRFSEIAKYGVDPPLRHIQFIPPDAWTAEDRDTLYARLRDSDDPFAGRWLGIFEEADRTRPKPPLWFMP